MNSFAFLIAEAEERHKIPTTAQMLTDLNIDKVTFINALEGASLALKSGIVPSADIITTVLRFGVYIGYFFALKKMATQSPGGQTVN